MLYLGLTEKARLSLVPCLLPVKCRSDWQQPLEQNSTSGPPSFCLSHTHNWNAAEGKSQTSGMRRDWNKCPKAKVKILMKTVSKSVRTTRTHEMHADKVQSIISQFESFLFGCITDTTKETWNDPSPSQDQKQKVSMFSQCQRAFLWLSVKAAPTLQLTSGVMLNTLYSITASSSTAFSKIFTLSCSGSKFFSQLLEITWATRTL